MPHEPYKALYLHLPFCKSRCGYCDFRTTDLPADDPSIDAYVEDLCLQIRRASKQGELGSIESVYIGGGTPSHVGMSRLSMLLYTLSLSLRLEPDVECSMEANPESLTERMVHDVWALGVNRLSIGVQSLDDAVLRILGRAHDADGARRAIAAAQTRFANVSVDVMCGIPGQSSKSLAATVREVAALGVGHVSVYPLSIEPGTPFHKAIRRKRMEAPDEDLQAEQMELAEELLEDEGLRRYEVASYARPGLECRHNQAYWTGVPYLGLGSGAATMTQDSSRRMRTQDGQITDDLDARQMAAEDLMLGMRLSCGISDAAASRAEALLPALPATLAELERLGLIEHREGRWRPTRRGWLCGNELYGRLLDLAP